VGNVEKAIEAPPLAESQGRPAEAKLNFGPGD